MCTFDDFGVFIGLTSLPLDNPIKFYNDEIKSLFINYKNNLKLNLPNEKDKYTEEYDECLYKPQGYYIFGEFDLAMIALIDDFEFGIRTFKPFNPRLYRNKILQNEGDNEDCCHSFAHKILLGPTLKINNIQNTSTKNIFKNKPQLPLLSITQIKLANTYILSYGYDFKKAVIIALDYYLQNKILNTQWKNKLKYLILDSYAWNDLSLVIFSDAYEKITEIIPKIREFTVGKVIKLLKKNKSDSWKIFNQKSLFNKILNEKNIENIEKHHPVIKHTITTLGFDFDILYEIKRKKHNNNDSSYNKIEKNDQFQPFCQWSTRGGHLYNAFKKISSINNIHLCIGRGDIIYPNSNGTILTKNFISLISSILLKDKIEDNLQSVYTIPTKILKLEKIEKCEKNKKHFDEEYIPLIRKYRNKIKKCAINIKLIKDVLTKLKSLWIPKVLKEDVINMISDFNYGIQNPNLYNKLLELHPFIQHIIDWILSPEIEKETMEERNDKINDIVHIFNHAYSNIIHPYYSTGEVTDFNIFFKGGIQQLITAYDGFCKNASSLFNNNYKIIYVEGDPEIATSDLAIRLNFYHIFHPEMFMTAGIHEIGNDFLRSKYFEEEHLNIHKLTYSKEHIIKILSKYLKGSKNIYNEYRDIIYIISPTFFRHVLCDICSLYLSYGGNSELFQYWYWGYFLTANSSYSSQDRIDEKVFIMFLLRTMLVFKYFDESYYKNLIKLEYSGDVKKLFIKNINRVKAFIDEFIALPAINNWFISIEKCINKIIEKIYNNEISSKDDLNKYIEKHSKVVMKSLKAGNIIRYDNKNVNKTSNFKDTQLILYSYLKLIKEKWGDDKDIVLKRDRDDGTVILKNQKNKLFFDPLGGTFISDPMIRRKLFKYRSTFIMSLWNIAVQNKGKYLIKIIKNK